MKTQMIATQLKNGLARKTLWIATWTIILAFSVSSAVADTMSQIQMATAAMTQGLLGNGNFLGALYGPDNGNTLHFTSYVDPSGNSFSYQLDAQYQGRDLSIQGHGNVDDTGLTWNFSSLMQVGGQLFQVNGTDSFTPNGTGYSAQMDQYLNQEGLLRPTINDFHDGTDYYGSPFDGTFFGTCYDTFNGQIVPPRWNCGGSWNNSSWEVSSPSYPFGYGVTITGSQPVSGGAGNFAMDVAAPEPSSLLLMGSGILGLGGLVRRRFLSVSRALSPRSTLGSANHAK